MISGPRRVLLFALALTACGSDRTVEVAPRAQDLGADDVASVAGERIDASTVAAIAKAQGTTLAIARDRAIRDALFALEARARGRAPRAAESSLLARTLLAQRRRELDGPVTDDELDAATRLHWLDLDRPEGFRVVHAVVIAAAPKGKPITDEIWTDVDAVGGRIAAAAGPAVERARTAPDDDASVLAELQKAVRVAGAGGFDVKAETLEPVAADGRVIGPNNAAYDTGFAAAVAKLRERGDMTAPFRSPFGVHVAILLGRTPAMTVPKEERRALVHDEVLDRRLVEARRVVAAANGPTVELADNAAALLDLVQVAGPAPVAAGGAP